MKEYGRYIIGILLLIVAIVLIVVMFNFVTGLFSNDPPPEQPAQTSRKVDLLAVPENGQAVQYTIIGQITALEEHQRVRITVNSDSRTVEVLQGYSNQVVKSQRLDNTQEAYEAFIAALNGVGFTKAVAPEGRGDEAQSCPLGRKYGYEVAPGTGESFRSWSTSCDSGQGTFTGNDGLVRTLFQRQIPDYKQYTSDVRLG